MKIWHSTYQLYPRFAFNSQAQKKFRKGALLRVRFDDQTVGYADVCPFPEMGDRPLELELQGLATGKPSILGERSLHFASVDAQARSEGRNLFDLSAKIKNHYLISDILRFDSSRLEDIARAGYTHFKIKLGRELTPETARLAEVVSVLSEAKRKRAARDLRLRLDFNAGLSRDRFVEWYDKNQSLLQPHLDFIEDPCPYDAREWRELSSRRELRLALDLAADPLKMGAEGAAVIVIKPAVQDVQTVLERFRATDKTFVFTHYMDFPLGQMCALQAAHEAWSTVADQIAVCGLQHQDLYEGFTFQDAIKSDGPYVVPPSGPGLGFADLLERQQWSELT